MRVKPTRLLLLALCAAAAACNGPVGETASQALVERGRYIVVDVAHCDGCHTPHTGPGQADMTRTLQGRELTPREGYASYGPPLAGIPGHFTEAQFEEFLRTGVRPDGSTPRPPMPRIRLNPEDARAVSAYIKTLPAPPLE